jgi:tRNA(Ser,Leu) C12 N-acetylase TAN1
MGVTFNSVVESPIETQVDDEPVSEKTIESLDRALSEIKAGTSFPTRTSRKGSACDRPLTFFSRAAPC